PLEDVMVQKLIEVQAPRPGGAHRRRQSRSVGTAPEPAAGSNRAAAGRLAVAEAAAPRPKAYRAYAEILQEIRLEKTRSQVLLGFLLSMGFTERFKDLEHDRPQLLGLYVATLILNVAATAVLVAPTAFRQLPFHRHMERQTLVAANRYVLSGLALLMCAIVGSLLFALSAIFKPFHVASIVAVGSLLWFIIWWFVFPMWSRRRHDRTEQPVAEEPATARLTPVPQASR